jgi:hypothetical protein
MQLGGKTEPEPFLPNITRMMKSRIRWLGHVPQMGEMKGLVTDGLIAGGGILK